MNARRIAILATLDTKAGEAAYLRDAIVARGYSTVVIDVGLDQDPQPLADVSAATVAQAGGETLDGLRHTRRDRAMRCMGTSAGTIVLERVRSGSIGAAIAVGGNQGTAIASFAMRMLPFGFPKLIVSTVASGNVRPYVGDSDIAMLFSVGDLLGGPNPITRCVLDEAAGAIVGMATSARDLGEVPPSLAVTAFGNTHRAVIEAMQVFAEAGWSVIPFHASGACGSAMERLIDEGTIQGVLDLTIHELLAEVFPDDVYVPVRAGRLTAAGRRGIPQVVVPGGLEYFCFGVPESVPPALRERPTHFHNPYNTNVRTNADELRTVAAVLAERLNAARGQVAVLIPTQGWSHVGSPGGVLHDPGTNQAFIDSLVDALDSRIPVDLIETTINDPAFARRAAGALLAMLEPLSVATT